MPRHKEFVFPESLIDEIAGLPLNPHVCMDSIELSIDRNGGVGSKILNQEFRDAFDALSAVDKQAWLLSHYSVLPVPQGLGKAGDLIIQKAASVWIVINNTEAIYMDAGSGLQRRSIEIVKGERMFIDWDIFNDNP